MERLISILFSLSSIAIVSSCSTPRDLVLLDKEKLEIVNNVIESECLDKFDNDVLLAVLKDNNLNPIIKNNQVYVDRKAMNKRDFFDNINRDIQNELLNDSIPKGYIPFKYKKLNAKENKYETRPLDDLDKTLLPNIIEKGGFHYIIVNDCLYVERELIDNQDFLSKAISMLDFKRGEGPNPYHKK